MEFRQFLQALMLVPAHVLKTGRQLIVRILAYTPLVRLLFRKPYIGATTTAGVT